MPHLHKIRDANKIEGHLLKISGCSFVIQIEIFLLQEQQFFLINLLKMRRLFLSYVMIRIGIIEVTFTSHREILTTEIERSKSHT